MGTGFRVQIINATGSAMRRTGQRACQMGWQPVEQVGANSIAEFYGEFEQALVNSIENAAEASYRLDGVADFEFTIRAKKSGVANLPSPYPPCGSGYGILVDWVDIPVGYVTYPPRDTSNQSSVGWIHDGVVTIAVGYFHKAVQQAIPPYPEPCYIPDGPASNRSALRPSVEHWAMNWMALYRPYIQQLKLTELTLPGTHDAGTYKASGLTTRWVQTQTASLEQQLSQGIRALDIRLSIDEAVEERFQFCHGEFLTNLSYREGMQQLLNFLHETSQEVVVLDFHRFEGDWSHADFQELAGLTEELLGEYQIPRGMGNESLGDILDKSGRVVVGMGRYSGYLDGIIPDDVLTWLNDNTSFWTTAVEQYWFGTSLTTWDYIREYMDEQLRNVCAPKGHLWALMAQYNNVVPGLGAPADIPVEISYFFAGERGLRANIIHTDWWNRALAGLTPLEPNIPNFSALINAVPLNMLKGYRRANNLPLFCDQFDLSEIGESNRGLLPNHLSQCDGT